MIAECAVSEYPAKQIVRRQMYNSFAEIYFCGILIRQTKFPIIYLSQPSLHCPHKNSFFTLIISPITLSAISAGVFAFISMPMGA